MNKVILDIEYSDLYAYKYYLKEANKLNLKTKIVYDNLRLSYHDIEFEGTRDNLIEFINRFYSPNCIASTEYLINLIE